MTVYIKSTDFAVKDVLLTGNPSKLIKGSEVDVEFNNLALADATNVKQTGAAGSIVLPTGTTSQRDASPSVGYYRYNTTSQLLEVYGTSGWQGSGGSTCTVEVKTATAGQTSFTLTNSYVPSTNTVQVFVNGLLLVTGTDYTETGANSIVFTSGLTLGDEVQFVVFGRSVGTVDAANASYTPAGTGAVATAVQGKLRELVSRAEYDSDANFNTAKAGKLSHDATNRFRATSFIAGDKELSGATLRDAVVVGRDVIGSTDCHAFADRTVMSGVTDSGTYGTFDATTELQGSNAQDHTYAFQNRNIYNGTGTVNNFSGFYHQPTIKNTGTITRLAGVHVRDFIKSGTTNVTINTGVYIEPLANGANNFAVVSTGDTPSYHGGKLSVGFPTSSPTATEGLAWVGTTLSGASQTGINSRGGASSSATFQYSAFNATAALSPGSYTCQEVHGLAVRNAGVGAGATLTKQYGVSIDALTSGSEIYAFRTKVTAGTNKWNIYQEGNAQNWISGNSFHGLTATVPTAKSHYSAQTTAAGTAPIKLTNGSLMTTPETGAFEFDGTNLYFTVGGVRKTVTLV